jgi:putative ABC transport system ATP-binding protein
MPDAAADAAIVCRGITKEYGTGGSQVLALRGVDLDVPGGEMTLLVGPSGCGKTTLLSVIAGILNPTAGELWVLGQNLTKMSSGQRVRFRGQNIGFVFQQFNLLPALTAEENVTVPLVIAGWHKQKALVRARELLASVEMSHRATALPTTLSGGQQQRVAICRALAHDPKLLVCDEPTSALDGQTGHTIMTILRGIAVQAGRAVVVVTHDSRIYGFGDRIAYMEDGRIVNIERQTPSLEIRQAEHGAPAMSIGAATPGETRP